MKVLIVQNTLIAGKPVNAGKIVETDDITLRILAENKKAVDYSKASPEQLKLVAKDAPKAAEAAPLKGVK